MAVEYREFVTGDAEELMQVWGAPDSVFSARFRSELVPSGDSPWIRSLVATDDGVPIAAGVIYTNAIHPGRYPAYVEVWSERRRESIGSALLAELQALAAGGPSGALGLTAKLAEGSAAVPFAAARGFDVVQKSWVYVLAPSSMPQPQITEGDGPQLEEALLGSVELTALVQKFYNAVHASWSPSDISVGQAQGLFLGEASGAKGGIVYRDAPASEGGKIQAFAISYERAPKSLDLLADADAVDALEGGADAVQPADLFVGYDPDLSDADAETALSALLALVSYKDPVQIEVDEAMTPFMSIVDRLNAVGALTPADATCLIVASSGSAGGPS
ncbi:hypothetical protein [Haematomicrobium sanguinis]|uniref:hypothetical protein n=1 Tax=Haematomicrobium sanguinis TaxID=479106 RepID=UPI000551ABAC|nr:hypothetical protein [Haematomicrobium sanguinis]